MVQTYTPCVCILCFVPFLLLLTGGDARCTYHQMWQSESLQLRCSMLNIIYFMYWSGVESLFHFESIAIPMQILTFAPNIHGWTPQATTKFSHLFPHPNHISKKLFKNITQLIHVQSFEWIIIVKCKPPWKSIQNARIVLNSTRM